MDSWSHMIPRQAQAARVICQLVQTRSEHKVGLDKLIARITRQPATAAKHRKGCMMPTRFLRWPGACTHLLHRRDLSFRNQVSHPGVHSFAPFPRPAGDSHPTCTSRCASMRDSGPRSPALGSFLCAKKTGVGEPSTFCIRLP